MQTIDQLREFVRRGQAAQSAADLAIARVKLLPPWKRCQADACQAWTRGEFCPQHRGFENEAADGAGGRLAAETHPRGASGSGASPARGPVARASNTTARKARKRNA